MSFHSQRRPGPPEWSGTAVLGDVCVLTVLAVVGLSTLRSCRRSTYCKVDKTLASGALRAARGWECPRQGRGSGYKQEVFLHLHF